MRVPASWPRKRPIEVVLVGEAPGFTEAQEGKPFVGVSGKLLDDLLVAAGIVRADCLVTNVFSARPPGNKVDHFFLKLTAVKKLLTDKGHKLTDVNKWLNGQAPAHPDAEPYVRYPRYGAVGLLNPEFLNELERLDQELKTANPKVVIALGATALWALTGRLGISDYRGVLIPSQGKPYKVMPTFHPAAVVRNMELRPLVAKDLEKARKSMDGSGEAITNRSIYVADTVQDLHVFEKMFIKNEVALDVEEEGARQVTSFSISASPETCLVVPVFDPGGLNYWNQEDEVQMWLWLQQLLTRKDLTVIMHNAAYDLSQLWRYGIKPLGPVKDTSLMHHAFQPEMKKKLGELAALYCNETAWKTMRTWGKNKINKRDE